MYFTPFLRRFHGLISCKIIFLCKHLFCGGYYCLSDILVIITYSINIFPDTVHFSHVIRKFWVRIRVKKEKNSHNSINKRSTSKITIKYVINRLLHVFCHIITHISPQKTSISPSQAQGDMGFLWADTGDDMAKNM